MQKKMTKYYAVHVGRQCGVLFDWPTCQESVSGFPRARFKSFLSMEEAQNWLKAQDMSSASVAPSTTAIPSTAPSSIPASLPTPAPTLPLLQPVEPTPQPIASIIPSQAAVTLPATAPSPVPVPVASIKPKRPAENSIDAIDPLEVGLSSEQISAFRAVVREGKSIFLTGCAGTGKSFLLRKIIEALPPQSTFCTASTGVAAAALPRGTSSVYFSDCLFVHCELILIHHCMLQPFTTGGVVPPAAIATATSCLTIN
jgi:hypothetical protein